MFTIFDTRFLMSLPIEVCSYRLTFVEIYVEVLKPPHKSERETFDISYHFQANYSIHYHPIVFVNSIVYFCFAFFIFSDSVKRIQFENRTIAPYSVTATYGRQRCQYILIYYQCMHRKMFDLVLSCAGDVEIHRIYSLF